jgi:hypothetical protein
VQGDQDRQGGPEGPGPSAAGVAPPDQAALEEQYRDFDSLIFSPARPALDEVVVVPPRRGAPEGLSLPPPDPAGPASPPRERLPVLPEGDLATVSVPRLLAVLHFGQATGALSVGRGPVKKLVLLDHGAPVLATSNVPGERFGPVCVRAGILDHPALGTLLRGLRPGETTAAALQARGLLAPAQRARLVAEQVLEIVWSAFSWREGSYRIALQPLPVRERVPLEIFTGDLILEGMRRVATLEQLRAELPPDLALAPVAEPAVELHRLTLRSREAQLLAHADGTKRVGDLVALSELRERDALAFLQACRHMGLLDVVDRVLASTRRIGFM